VINLNANYFNDILSRANKIFAGGSMEDSESRDATVLIAAIERAKEEMQYAENYFESVYDPDLVDHAIYYREAARKKYDYLLKLAKKEGLIKAE